MNGIEKFVTESMLTKEEEDMASGKPIAKARPRQKPTVTLTSVSIPVLERKWTDIETQRSNDHKCFEVSKTAARLLRRDTTVLRGLDGAIHHNDIVEECREKKFNDAAQWPLEDWITKLAEGGGAKKRFQYCLDPKLFQSIPVPSSNSRTIRRKCLLILRCKTTYCCREDLSSTSTTSGTRVN